MSDGRRSPDPALQQQAFNRLAKRIDESMGAISDRIEAGFDRVNDRIDRIDRDMATNDLDRQAAQREMNELRRDLGELRDAFGLAESARVEKAAEGAARGAAKGAGQAHATIWKSKAGAAVAVALGFTAIVTALDKLPSAVRKVESFWLYMRGPDEIRSVPEKDKTDGR